MVTGCKEKRVIVVESSIYDAVEKNVEQLKQDWLNEGAAEVEILKFPKSGRPQDLRKILQNIYNNHNTSILRGALLLGKIPFAPFQMLINDTGVKAIRDSNHYPEYFVLMEACFES